MEQNLRAIEPAHLLGLTRVCTQSMTVDNRPRLRYNSFDGVNDMTKTAHTIRDNLIRTIEGKQAALDKMCVNNSCTVEFMSDVEVAVYRAAAEFLKINIDELKRILADINVVIGGEE